MRWKWKKCVSKSWLDVQKLDSNNLNKAYKKVVANKGVAGVDGITVEEEFDYLKENGDKIKNQIRKRRYKPQPVKLEARGLKFVR